MFKIAAIVLIIGGVLALMTSAWRGIQSWRLVQDSGKSQGIVIDMAEVKGPNNAILWAPRVRYVKPDGATREFVSAMSSTSPRYTAGQQVPVRYSLRTENHAEIDDWGSLWGNTVALLVLGLVLCAIGGVTYWLESMGPEAVKNLDPFKIVGSVCNIVGPLMLLVAALQLSVTLKFIASAKTTTGVVERMEIIYSSSSPSFSYYPVVVFEAHGRPVHFVSQVGSYPAGYEQGQQVEVIYPEAFPERARINAWLEIWIGVLISAGIGTIFTVLGRLLTSLIAGTG